MQYLVQNMQCQFIFQRLDLILSHFAQPYMVAEISITNKKRKLVT